VIRTALFPALMALIGLALIVRTLTAGGGVTSIGLLLGILFLAAGLGRLYLARRWRG
jgi:hypothetical protein